MYRWLNELSAQFLSQDYLVNGQSVDDRVTIIANKAEQILGIAGYSDKLKSYFQKGWYSFSTPVWTNFGNDRGLPISCFGSYIEDSMVSIVDTWAEVSMMTKCGGGTSAYFGELRPRGSEVKNNGKSPGSVHFMKAFDTLINIISQGSARRGNFTPYLPIDHKDIMEFLSIKTEGHPIQDLTFGVCISDEWMNSMIDGDKQKRKVWARVLEARNNIGFPYLFFSGNVNKNKPECYGKFNISHTNLCVAGDQLVPTSKGLRKVKDLYESRENLVLFDGNKTVQASKMEIKERNAKVYEIETESGRKHKVTSYHKILTERGMVECKNLSDNDRVAFQYKEGIFGTNSAPEMAFLLGLYHGDGTQTDDNIQICIWENDFDLKNEIENSINKVYQDNNWNTYEIKNQYGYTGSYRDANIPKFAQATVLENSDQKLVLRSKKLKQFGFKKHIVPEWILLSDKETQWQYIRGLYYSDGTVNLGSSNGQPLQLSLASINKEFLREIQIILSNLGIKSSIHLLREEGWQLLPDGYGGQDWFWSQTCWRLVTGNKNDALKFNKATGFLDRKGVLLEDREYRDNSKKFDKIKSIKFIGFEDVYCTTVDSDEHLWVCNSIITSNCTEIMLPDNFEESFVCDLSSLNALYYDEWKDTDAVEVLTFFLDAVMTEFIEKARHVKHLERAVRFAERHRALGIGVFGWHSLLQSKMIPYESMEAKYLNVELFKNVREKSYAASEKLAQLFGEPQVCLGTGRRNATLMAVAPTKSSSFIIEQASEMTEPFRSNYYVKDLAKGKFSVKNKYLEKLLESKGKNDKKTWKSILENNGSVQHLTFLSSEEKMVFKTFEEISPMEVIIQAAQRQKYIDQGQSINLMIHPKTPTKEVNALIIEAWRMGIKSLYYQYSVNSAQEFSRSLMDCKSCQA